MIIACPFKRFNACDSDTDRISLKCSNPNGSILLLKQEIVHLLIETLRMNAENLRRTHRHGTIHEHRNTLQRTVLVCLVQQIKQLLRTFDGERGNQHLAATLDRIAHNRTKRLVIPCGRLMKTAAVRTLHQHDIHIGHDSRILQQLIISTTYVTRKQQPLPLPVVTVIDIKAHLRSPQNMACIVKRHGNAIAKLHGPLIPCRHKLIHTFHGILLRIDRHGRRIMPPTPLIHLIEEIAVALLNAARIRQHNLAQIARRMRRIDIAVKTVLHQIRQIARMVDMRMGQHHAIDRFRIEIGKIPVDPQRFLAPALIHAAIQQNAPSVHLKQMLGPCRRTCRSTEMYFHHSKS